MGTQRVAEVLIAQENFNVWFQADVPRVFENMSNRESDHYRTKVHPLYSLVMFPAVLLIEKLTGATPLDAVRLIVAFTASVWISLLFGLLRFMGRTRLEAAVFTVVGAVSASAVCWFSVPEAFAVGSISILAALGLVALAEHRQMSPASYAVVSALTLSFSVTNWMAGIVAAFASYPWRKALRISIYAFCAVVLLWGVEKSLFSSAVFFLGDKEEARYVLPREAGGPPTVVKSFLFHSLIIPAIREVEDEATRNTIMSVQFSRPGSGGLAGGLAVGIWALLLILGAWGFFATKTHRSLRVVLGVTLVGQLMLHVVYGPETFNYALHFAALLIILAAFGTMTPARPVVLLLAGVLAVSVGINNASQFQKATQFVQTRITPAYSVRRAMERRPSDPWPRSSGHVVLAIPGSDELDKAYHEPGGSFSPSVASFGVSIWITHPDGRILATSDDIPRDLIRQEFVRTEDRPLPDIMTETPYYRAQWASAGAGRWMLGLRPFSIAGTKSAVVIRSVGPAGGPIQSLEWDGRRLRVGLRWTVTLDPPPLSAELGEEGVGGWTTARTGRTRWTGLGGWGVARFELAEGRDLKLLIEDSKPTATVASGLSAASSDLRVQIPDDEFRASLESQVAHMMMGVVDRQPRPGDPMAYPLAWQRDGAYIVAALARVGKLAEAKELSTDLAERDFFGGFGPEADAPGLAIWALEEVAVRLHQPEFDRWLWPHVRRKADLILDMLSTARPIHVPAVGPIVPLYRHDPELTLVAEPARNQLIMGRMDWHRPVFYINAVSYRGLLSAARLADRVGEPDSARHLRVRAGDLERAWASAFRERKRDGLESVLKRLRMLRGAVDIASGRDNPRTYIAGLWPTWIAASSKDLYARELEKRWNDSQDVERGFLKPPVWTYFNLAEAHQWLFLDRADRVWSTLRWFWNHQASPGLYTWWEGSGRDADPFHRWQDVRGWVRPPYVTPHYWTAAEMLSLQLDMLGYVDESTNEPVVIIGAGIPAAWLRSPMSVRGLSTRVGRIDWSWDGSRMSVRFYGPRYPVRLGPAFGTGTPVQVE